MERSVKRSIRLMRTAALAFTLCAVAPATFAQDLATNAKTVERIISEYRLGAGDKVRVIVFGEEALSKEFQVSSAGNISLPLVGEVGAACLTITELQAAIAVKLSDGYLKDPKVSAEVLTYRPFYILGEVNRPGEYPYTSILTVMNAVATAQGFTYRADQKKVYMRRAAEQKEQSYPLTSTTLVAPGDTIRIGERFF